MSRDRPESCGRCSLSSAVDVAEAGRDRGDDRHSDPYAGDRIEVDEAELRSVSPGVWLSRFADALDDAVTELTWR